MVWIALLIFFIGDIIFMYSVWKKQEQTKQFWKDLKNDG